jgi:hypothetical protein
VASCARGIQLSGGIRTEGWRTGLALGDAGKGIGSMDDAEAGIGMGWIMEGVESSWGVYGRESAGECGKRGRDRDRGGEGVSSEESCG